MSSDSVSSHAGDILLPAVPAIAVRPGQAAICTADGMIEELDAKAARKILQEPALTCHTFFSAQRLGAPPPPWPLHFDVLELFAFVRPAQFVLPTPSGLARALEIEAPDTLEDQAVTLMQVAEALLGELSRPTYPHTPETRRCAATMAQAGWPWGEAVLAALGADRNESRGDWSSGLDIWTALEDWQERAPEGEPGTQPVGEEEARARLHTILGERREVRAAQADYASSVTHCFDPREKGGAPNVLLAEAGTGIGKTAGYIAPASLWAEKNGPAVWISTYTKNLQRQIDQELTYLFPDPAEKAQKVVVRKGRENYLCLLNLQEVTGGSSTGGPARGQGGTLVRSAIALGLVARWARYTRDGDMVGGDFPAWLTPILTQNPARVQAAGIQSAGLTDRRGECIFSACPHYRKCFIEKAVRRARHANIVIANHALVMNQASVEFSLTAPVVVEDPLELDPDGKERSSEVIPEFRRHFVFDEGHHLFDAADNTFSPHLTGFECADLRRWIRGPEGAGGRGRGRGLLDRVGDLTGDSQRTEELLRESIRAANFLSGPGSLARVTSGNPQGPSEGFFSKVYAQVLARASHPDSPFDLECDLDPLVDGLLDYAAEFAEALKDLARPMAGLARALSERLDDEAEDLDSNERGRIDGAVRGIERRARLMIPSWIQMLLSLGEPTPDEFVDWFGVQRAFGRDADVGMYRHWLDPTVPFTATVLEPSQGALITSATLRDQRPAEGDMPSDDWESADIRTGAAHLPVPAQRAHFASPFDYPAQSRVLVVTDVNRNSTEQVASAYRALFKASGGGALGLFTAINRLRGVYNEIAAPLQTEGVTLYAQHMDAMDTGTLVDLFRAEENACLLGTDAVRDGVDVPGSSLRLLVFDRVPWPRPSILHKARRNGPMGRGYDDLITRLRIKQAYGRLIRQADDKGVFVMLDARMPSRLGTAFPDGVEIERIGLKEACDIVRDFLP